MIGRDHLRAQFAMERFRKKACKPFGETWAAPLVKATLRRSEEHLFE